MHPDPTRRRFLRAAAVVCVPLLSGCASDVHWPEDVPGQPDLVLKNCHSEAVELRVSVRHVETDETVHDESHSVPGDFCSDMGPSYHIEQVWTSPGEYAVRAAGDGVESAEGTVTLSELEVDEDTGTRSIHVSHGEITIPT